MNLTADSIESMTVKEAVVALVKVQEAIASLPAVKRRPYLKDQTREPDIRTAFESPFVYERIWYQMMVTDLRRVIYGEEPEDQTPISAYLPRMVSRG